MHTDTATLFDRVIVILRAHDAGHLTAAEAEDLVDLEAAYCPLHDHGDGGDAA